MKRLILVACLFLMPACAPPVSVVTPQGQAAYKADQIVTRVNELQNAAIAANTSQQLSTDATRLIVEFCVGADKTLAQTPNGWQATVTIGWASLKASLPVITNPAVLAAIGAVDVLLGSVR